MPCRYLIPSRQSELTRLFGLIGLASGATHHGALDLAAVDTMDTDLHDGMVAIMGIRRRAFRYVLCDTLKPPPLARPARACHLVPALPARPQHPDQST
ncbi:hypothetical protein C8J57DRAFT_1723022 [Mycena rebaudengoi]|nr:hypothetical protein C8J57DRAFT_1723022 [Mycena rebaudengoi]